MESIVGTVCKLEGNSLLIKDTYFVYICNDLYIVRPTFTKTVKIVEDIVGKVENFEGVFAEKAAKLLEVVKQEFTGELFRIKVNSKKTEVVEYVELSDYPIEAECIEFLHRFSQVLLNPFA